MKKIILTIVSSLVGALLIATIILACTTYTAYGLVNDKAYSIKVYKNGYSDFVREYDSNDTEFKTVFEKINGTFKENNLSAMFQGVGKFKVSVKNEERKIKDVVENNDGSYFVAFNYAEDQKLVIKGKEYVNENTTTKETVKYRELWMEVRNTANFGEYTIYLIDPSMGGRETSYYQVKLIAEQASLYEYIGTVKTN